MIFLIFFSLILAAAPCRAQNQEPPMATTASEIQAPMAPAVSSAPAAAPPSISTSPYLPAYQSLAPGGLTGFYLFADGGPDDNWYVGFNNAWIVRLPPIPAGKFSRAFIGARLGRAKSGPDSDRPWVKNVIDGKIYMAVSQTPSFSAQQSYFLAETTDLPREPDPQGSLEGVGAARWFWAEVPLQALSADAPNYLIIWSPTPAFTSSVNSPILAASDKPSPFCQPPPCSWNNRSIVGYAPTDVDGTLQTPLSNLFPALAVKLVPPPAAGRGKVSVRDFSVSPQTGGGYLVRVSAGGEDVSGVWLESSPDQLDWSRITPVQSQPPYFFSLDVGQAPEPGQYLRAAVGNSFGNSAYSTPYAIPFPPQE